MAEAAPEQLDVWDELLKREEAKEHDPEWQKDNLEYDLRSTRWICDKAKASEAYAQNIYAALCNNGFIKLEVIPILTEKEWSCSWRYAGGIVAHMRQAGDYIDWYCSGIRDADFGDPDVEFNEEQKLRLDIVNRYVPEGCITNEIRADFQRLGWVPAKGGDWEHFE